MYSKLIHWDLVMNELVKVQKIINSIKIAVVRHLPL